VCSFTLPIDPLLPGPGHDHGCAPLSDQPPSQPHRSPIDIALVGDGPLALVANHTADSVSLVDLDRGNRSGGTTVWPKTRGGGGGSGRQGTRRSAISGRARSPGWPSKIKRWPRSGRFPSAPGHAGSYSRAGTARASWSLSAGQDEVPPARGGHRESNTSLAGRRASRDTWLYRPTANGWPRPATGRRRCAAGTWKPAQFTGSATSATPSISAAWCFLRATMPSSVPTPCAAISRLPRPTLRKAG